MCDALKCSLLAMTLLATATVAAAEDDRLDDPTRPSHVRPAGSPERPARAPSWRVESIIVSPGRRLAVINDRVVGVDDRINGARVIEILPYEVTVEYQGEYRRISLVPTRVKRPAD